MPNVKAIQEKYRAGVDQIADECIAVRLRMLHRVVTGIYDDALRPIGLTVGQLNILVIVTKLDSPNQNAVGKALHMEKSTLSRNTERLRQNGWLTVSRDKLRHLGVTPEGRDLILKSLPLWQAAQERARKLIGSDFEMRMRDAVNAMGGRRPWT